MRKKAFWIAWIVVCLLAAGALALILRPGAVFDGDRIRQTDPQRFTLRFARMNRDDAETFSLQAGDVLRVSWRIESGSADIVIGRAVEAPIYQANGRGKGDEADFELTIPETGDYTISISARQARGWMEFEEKRRE